MIVMFVIVLSLLIVLLILGFIEHYLHMKRVNSVKTRILINGTRGKTTITRLLVSSLQSAGIKTIGRTTGSEAQIILPSGEIEEIKRRRPARVYELIKFWKRAEECGAECAVVECMALQKENQKAIRDTLVSPTSVVIANTFVDHVPEMGRSIESTSEVLCMSIPKNAKLYVTEHLYDDFQDVTFVDAKSETSPREDIHPSAIAIVRAILKDMKINEEYLNEGIKNFIPDKGLLKPFNVGSSSLFIPSFSINDLSSMNSALSKWNRKVNLIYNNRKDREYRISLFDDVLKTNKDIIDKVYVIGDYKNKVMRHFGKLAAAHAISIDDLKGVIDSSTDQVFIGLGNIKGEGEELIALFE